MYIKDISIKRLWGVYKKIDYGIYLYEPLKRQ